MAGSRYGQGGGGVEREGGAQTDQARTESEEIDGPSGMLFMAKLYQSSPSEVPCDQCVLSVCAGSVLNL